MSYFLGVDLGGTKTAVSLATEDLTIVARRRFATAQAGGPGGAIDRIVADAASLIKETHCPEGSVLACGISSGGPLDPTRGIILSPPNLPEWDRIPMTDILAARLGMPCYLENDANACALAEWRLGAGKGTSTMVFLTFGTGMGAGLIVDGRLHRGPDCLAGEVGHIRVSPRGPEAYAKRGSFEAFCSGAGIAKMAKDAARAGFRRGEPVAFCAGPEALEEVSAKSVGQAAAAGDAMAISILERSGRYLGYGLAALIDLLNPEAIVIGSMFVRCQEFIYPEAERVISQEALPAAAKRCRIAPAALGEELGDYAALMVASAGGAQGSAIPYRHGQHEQGHREDEGTDLE